MRCSLALAPILQSNESRTRILRCAAEAKPIDHHDHGDVVLFLLEKVVLDLPRDLLRSLHGSAARKLKHRHDAALILIRQETGGEVKHHQNQQRYDDCIRDEPPKGLLDDARDTALMFIAESIEGAVEPTKETAVLVGMCGG